MKDILAEICATKREYVTSCEARTPLSTLRDMAACAPAPRGFHRALQQKVASGDTGLIAEIKKASPSRGLIRADFNPAQHAKDYAAAGATCLSILTDSPYFQGEDAYLIAARAACNLPVLRKDFMLTPYQVWEARSMGADCILLIMACLDDAQAAELEALAHQLGMDVLIEVHDEAELHRALKLKSRLLGINNRNLKTLDISLQTSVHLRHLVPDDYTLVCESGIYSHADILHMQQHGMHCFLVGESLMKQADIQRATRQLLQGESAA